jgi:glycosyltransferase involved in cell wall biosynthesis
VNILHVNMSIDAVTGGGTVERIRQLHEHMLPMEGISSRILSVVASEVSALSPSDDIVVLPCWNKRWYLPGPKLLLIYRMVKQADVIHLMNHWTFLNALVYWMAWLTRTPYVVCPAGSLPLFGRSLGLKRWYNRVVGRALMRNASAAIAIAEDEREQLIEYGVADKHIHHIPNGVRPEDFACKEKKLFREHAGLDGQDYLLFVGRLNEIKGPDLLLEAFIDISGEFPDLHLAFAGPDGGMLGSLQARADEAGIMGRVHFAGFTGGRTKSSAYHGAKMLVVPSRQEAMSIVALEAAICATPVVLTDRCGFSALAESGAGKECKADAASIAEILRGLIPDAALLARMGERGHELAMSSYTWDISTHRHIELFKACVQGRDL